MRRQHSLCAPIAIALALGAGCGTTPLQNGGAGSGGHAGTGTGGGGHAGTGTGSGGHAGTGTGGSAAGGNGHDDCHSDGDCPQGICSSPPCSELLCALGNDGFHHCTPRTPPGLSLCPTGSAMPCCQSEADCATMPHGHCIPYAYNYCGGPAPPQGNECRYDACTGDADCTASANGVCTTGYPRICVYGVCRTNPDCTAGPDGRCVLASVGRFCPGEAVFCRYSTDPCASNGDCPGNGTGFGQACVPNAGGQGTICKDVPPPPP